MLFVAQFVFFPVKHYPVLLLEALSLSLFHKCHLFLLHNSHKRREPLVRFRHVHLFLRIQWMIDLNALFQNVAFFLLLNFLAFLVYFLYHHLCFDGMILHLYLFFLLMTGMLLYGGLYRLRFFVFDEQFYYFFSIYMIVLEFMILMHRN